MIRSVRPLTRAWTGAWRAAWRGHASSFAVSHCALWCADSFLALETGQERAIDADHGHVDDLD